MFTSLRGPTQMLLPATLQDGVSLFTFFVTDELCREKQLYLQDDIGRNVILLVQYMFSNKVWLLNYKDDGRWGVETIKTINALQPAQNSSLDIHIESRIIFVSVAGATLANVPVTLNLRLATKVVVKGPVLLQTVLFVSHDGIRHILLDQPAEIFATQQRTSMESSSSVLLPRTGSKVLEEKSRFSLHGVPSVITATVTATTTATQPPAEGTLGASTSSSISPTDSTPRADYSFNKSKKISAAELSRLKEKAAAAFEEMRLKSALRTEMWKLKFSQETVNPAGPSVSQSVRTLTPSRMNHHSATIEPQGYEPSQVVKTVTFLNIVQRTSESAANAQPTGEPLLSTSNPDIRDQHQEESTSEPAAADSSQWPKPETMHEPRTARRFSENLVTPETEVAGRFIPITSTEQPFMASLVTLVAGSSNPRINASRAREVTSATSGFNAPGPAYQRQDIIAGTAIVMSDTQPSSSDRNPRVTESGLATPESDCSDKGDLIRCKTVMNIDKNHS